MNTPLSTRLEEHAVRSGAASSTARRRVYFYVGRAAHPVYREQFTTAPDGYTYLPSHPDLADLATFGGSVSRHGTVRGKLVRQAKLFAVAAFALAGRVRRVHVDPPRGTALIHSAQFLLKNSSVPYVVDFEDVHVFCLYQRRALDRPWARRRLLEAIEDDSCRYLLPWTNKARDGLLAVIDPAYREHVAARAVTVLPAIRPTASVPRRHGREPLRVAFVGTRFFEKGGVEAVAAVERLRRTHEIELHMVSFVPDEWRRMSDAEWLHLHAWLPPTGIRKLFERCHVLLFPTHTDTFGYVVLEALAAALPVVAPDHHSLPQLVEHDVSGLLFPRENSLFREDGRPRYPMLVPPFAPRSFLLALRTPTNAYVDGIAEQLARIADDRDGYERLSAGALERVRSGPLSVEHRRRQLREIYDRAIA